MGAHPTLSASAPTLRAPDGLAAVFHDGEVRRFKAGLVGHADVLGRLTQCQQPTQRYSASKLSHCFLHILPYSTSVSMRRTVSTLTLIV